MHFVGRTMKYSNRLLPLERSRLLTGHTMLKISRFTQIFFTLYELLLVIIVFQSAGLVDSFKKATETLAPQVLLGIISNLVTAKYS
jgi:hypothetical protein